MSEVKLPPPVRLGYIDKGHARVEVLGYTAEHVRAAVLAERERAARVCERHAAEAYQGDGFDGAYEAGSANGAKMIAAAIRKGEVDE